MRAFAPVLLACVLLAGCAAHGPDSAFDLAGTTTPAPATATPPERPPGNPAVGFTDNPLIVNSRPLPIDSWSRLGGGDALELYFTVGSPDCSGVHATARETPDTVAVELRVGTLPEAIGRMCTMIVVFGTLNVPLRSPIRDRQVLAVY